MGAGVPPPSSTLCPLCALVMGPHERQCPRCGMRLGGPEATALTRINADIERLHAQRNDLIALLRTADAVPGTPPMRPPAARPEHAPTVPVATAPPPFQAPPPVPPPRADRREWRPESVQNVLLSLGVLLLVAAVLVFAAVAWGRLGYAGRAAILLGVTLATAAGSRYARGRGLLATSEAIASFTVMLCLVDAFALRRAGLFGLDGTDLATYWSVATGVVAVAVAAFALSTPVVVARVSSAVLGQAPLLITAVRLQGATAATRATVFAAQVAWSLVLGRWLRGRERAAPAGDLLLLSGAATWPFVVIVATVGAFPEVARLAAVWPAALMLVASAAIAAAGAWVVRDRPSEHAVLAGLACVPLTLAVLALARVWVAPRHLALVLATDGLVLLVVAARAAPTRRAGPGIIGVAAVALSVALSLPAIGYGLLGPLRWVADPWSLEPGTAARRALVAGYDWQGSWVTMAVIAAAAIAAALIAVVQPAWRRGVATFVLVSGDAAWLLLPYVAGWSYPWAVAWDTALALGLAAVTLTDRRRPESQLLGAVRVVDLEVASAGVMTMLLGWSLADRVATVAILGVAIALTAAHAAVRRREGAIAAAACAALVCGEVAAVMRFGGAPFDRTGFVVALAVAAALGGAALLRRVTPLDVGVEVGAAVGYAGALLATSGAPGWATWTLAVGGVAAAAHALRTDRRAAAVAGGVLLGAAWSLADGAATIVVLGVSIMMSASHAITRHREGAAGAVAAGLCAALVCAEVAEVMRFGGAPVDRTGFVVALVAAVALGVAALLRRVTPLDVGVEVGAIVAYAGALLASAEDPGWASWTLAVGGIAALVHALRPDRRVAAVVGGVLLSACSWVRLYIADVDVPEAYAAPLAVVALVTGHVRRRAAPISSWAAYGTGLSLALLPSLFVTVTDPGLTRPLTLGLVALVVVLIGARQRLQAPLVLGSITLAVDAIVQVAPLAAALPRWISLAIAGSILVGVGATYERRLRDLRRLHERVADMA